AGSWSAAKMTGRLAGVKLDEIINRTPTVVSRRYILTLEAILRPKVNVVTVVCKRMCIGRAKAANKEAA
ncbi:hypothetical protein AF383_24355, partial [Salmonella enterica subsp. enterica serovar Typhimurium]